MKLGMLIRKLQEREIHWVSHNDSDQEIYSCQILNANKTQKPGVLYLFSPDQFPAGLPSELDTAGSHLLSAGPLPKAPGGYRFHNCNLLEVKSPVSMEVLLDEMEELFIQDQILTQHLKQLVAVLHGNLGLQALTDSAYDLLHNPILIVDSSYKILSSCQNVIQGRPDLEAQRAYGYVLEANIQEIKRARLYEKARQKKYPVYNKSPNASEGWITALVYVHGIEAAHIAVSDSNHPFTEHDFELIDFLCRLVALELQKTDFYRVNESLMHSFFLSELLEHHVRDMPTILRRAQSLNWKLTSYFRIMTIFQEHAEVFDQMAQLISGQIHKLLPNSHWVIHDGHIVFLLCLDNPSLNQFRGETELRAYLKVNHLTASLSRCYHSLTDTTKFYKESLAAYQLGQRFKPEEPLYIYTDYLCHHIGGIVAEENSLSDFYHPAIEKIRAYDEKHHTALLPTLKEYLTYPDQPGVAAGRLFIHKNTLFYRMAKLKELFSLDLSNGEERLMLHLSLKFMEMETSS